MWSRDIIFNLFTFSLLSDDIARGEIMKVFVANVDKYAAREIGKIFKQSVIGSTKQDELMEEETDEDNTAGGTDKEGFTVVGTLSSGQSEAPSWVDELLQPASTDHLIAILMTCDVIVYDISGSHDLVEEASLAVQSLHDHMSSFVTQKIFICVSTVLTWARTKPLNPDEPDIPFTEEDYRRRRTHPNFKEHIAAEKQVIKFGKTDKSKFITYVISSGLQYGAGENIFHFLFKSAWLENDKELSIFGEGQNIIPTIHVTDLAYVIVNIVDNKPKTKYIVAVDDSNSTLEDIVKAISKNLGTGLVKCIPTEECLLLSDLSQYHFDQLLVNLLMEGACIKESMKINWIAESGLVENITNVITEYKETRRLLPIRICILGPPAVGKTLIAAQLCKYYKLHHVKMSDVIQEAIDRLQRKASRSDPTDNEEEDDAEAQEAKEYLDLLKDDKEENKGRYSSQHILKFFKEKLLSMPCQNQGFVLDGFPKTEEDAKELFAPEEDLIDDTENQQDSYNKLIMPELVVSLDADNEFLKDRVINLPQTQVTGTHNTEEGLLRRLKNFREQNEEDITVLNYFDELEIHPLHIKVAEDTSNFNSKTVDDIKKIIKEPRNYGLTPEEIEELDRIEEEKRIERETKEEEERKKHESLEKSLRAQRESEWSERLAQVQKEEQEMLEAHSIPLRNYLMKHVMPTLTEGLIEVCKIRPEDPIDYLAEYLFKNNPQID